VALRVRPISVAELEEGATLIAHKVDEQMVVLMDPMEDPDDILRAHRSREKSYLFDVAFDFTATQEMVYQATTKSLIEGVISGYNATVFAYGPTGCGKTYTMLGTDHEPGIYVRTLNDLFCAIEETGNDMEYEVSTSYLEVGPPSTLSRGLGQEAHRTGLAHLPGARSRGTFLRYSVYIGTGGNCTYTDRLGPASLRYLATASDAHLYECYHQAMRARCFPLDAEAPYAHPIYNEMIRDLLNPALGYLELREDSKGVIQVAGITEVSTEVRQGRLFMIDLAGSERASQTQNRGQRMKEGAHINRSLLALGNCINALSDKNSNKYINYPKVQLHSEKGERAEMGPLREQLISAFQEQMDVRRHLLELENHAMEVQIDTSRHLLTIAGGDAAAAHRLRGAARGAQPAVPRARARDYNLAVPQHLEELYEVYLREQEEGSLERATIMDRVASRALQDSSLPKISRAGTLLTPESDPESVKTLSSEAQLLQSSFLPPISTDSEANHVLKASSGAWQVKSSSVPTPPPIPIGSLVTQEAPTQDSLGSLSGRINSSPDSKRKEILTGTKCISVKAARRRSRALGAEGRHLLAPSMERSSLSLHSLSEADEVRPPGLLACKRPPSPTLQHAASEDNLSSSTGEAPSRAVEHRGDGRQGLPPHLTALQPTQLSHPKTHVLGPRPVQSISDHRVQVCGHPAPGTRHLGKVTLPMAKVKLPPSQNT
ncbi:hypothetical protein E2I00_008315, partial [Balaenoptera physalus]